VDGLGEDVERLTSAVTAATIGPMSSTNVKVEEG